jgi:hypothetical protein
MPKSFRTVNIVLVFAYTPEIKKLGMTRKSAIRIV